MADPWEMHDWMLSVESHVQKFDLDEQWYTLGQADMDNMTWPDFVFKVSFRKLTDLIMNELSESPDWFRLEKKVRLKIKAQK